MTGYLNRWTALGGWVVVMVVAWMLYVPTGISVSSFAVMAVTGPLVVLMLSALWRSQQPVPSVGQRRAEEDEAERTAKAHP